MCTVIIGFDPTADWPVVLLGLRDEAVDRPWDAPGAWWPELGDGVRGVHDREAGGAWLATNAEPARAAVVLNRHEVVAEPADGYISRGALPLDSVTGSLGEPSDPRFRSYNLVELTPESVRFTRWDGRAVTSTELPPGVHMITHEGPDVASVPRELRWLPEFQAAARPTGVLDSGSWQPWLGVLADSSSLSTSDDQALFRSDVIDGHHYASLSVSTLALQPGRVDLRHARLDHPGHLEDRKSVV